VLFRSVAEHADQGNVVELTTKSSGSYFFKPAAGFAVAASVALASVLGFQMLSQSPVDDFAQPMAAISAPATQSLNISSAADTVAFSVDHVDEPIGEFDDVIYAQQSLMDDGQWTRITRIGSILLDNNILTRPPELSTNVGLSTSVPPFARATNLEAAKPE